MEKKQQIKYMFSYLIFSSKPKRNILLHVSFCRTKEKPPPLLFADVQCGSGRCARAGTRDH